MSATPPPLRLLRVGLADNTGSTRVLRGETARGRPHCYVVARSRRGDGLTTYRETPAPAGLIPSTTLPPCVHKLMTDTFAQIERDPSICGTLPRDL